MSARLVSIELTNFRGFAETQRLDLDANIVLVRGDNGSGKTSLTDGVLWVLTGALQHLTDRTKGLRQTHDAIANRYCTGPSRVTLTLQSDDGTWELERIGSAQTSSLRVSLNGRPHSQDEHLARVFGIDTTKELVAAVSTWGILRQDAIRSVLDTGAAALHERMSSVIGLSEVTRFREACRAAAKTSAQARRLSETSLATAESLVAAARQRVEANQITAHRSSNDSLGQRVQAALSSVMSGLEVDASAVNDIGDVVEMGREVSGLIEPASVAADSFDTYVSAVAAVREDSRGLQQELDTARVQATELRELTSSAQQLAETALRLLGDRCPVCDQSIDAESVRQKLKRDLEANSSRMIAANEAHNMVSVLDQRLVDVQTKEAARARAESRLTRATDDLDSRLAVARYVRVITSTRQHEELRSLARRLDEARSILRTVHAELQADAEAEAVRLRASFDAATAELSRTRLEVEAAARRDSAAKKLDKASQVAADRIVARLLEQLEPSFAEVFDRLAPHPTFSELRARADVYYNKNQIVPEVFDPVRNVSANPLLVYSEGQLNTVALSYFLGLALNASAASLGFMVLDDPLQAMDVLGVLGFADLCRRLRQERQLLITTHDRRYADLLARKLAPREVSHSTIVHDFESWSVSGPKIATRKEGFRATSPVLLRKSS